MGPPTPHRPLAPRVALAVTVLLVALILVLRYFLPLTPATRPYEFGNGVRVVLLSISHTREDGADLVTWGVTVNNPTDADLVLRPTATCRHGVPPRDAGVPGSPAEPAESVVVPAHQSASWADSCPSPASGRWWLYTLELNETAGDDRYPPVTIAGKAH